MRHNRVILACFAALVALPGPFGCGGHEDGTIVESPEAKAADVDGQKGMQDYMNSKSKAKRGS